MHAEEVIILRSLSSGAHSPKALPPMLMLGLDRRCGETVTEPAKKASVIFRERLLLLVLRRRGLAPSPEILEAAAWKTYA